MVVGASKTQAPKENLDLQFGCEPECKACPHRRLSLSDSLSEKETFVRRVLFRWNEKVEKIRSSGAEWGYRRRATLRVFRSERGYEAGLSNGERDEKIISIYRCPLHTSELNARVLEVLKWIQGIDLGPLYYLIVNEGLVTLVCKGTVEEYLNRFNEAFKTFRSAAGIVGVWAHFNPSVGRKVWSARAWHHIWGSRFDSLLNGFKIGPRSFFQPQDDLLVDVYKSCSAFFGRGHSTRRVIDLYCGIGISARNWLLNDFSVSANELDAFSFDLIQENLKDLNNFSLFRGRAKDRLIDFDRESDAVAAFFNPPRLGLEPEVINWVQRKTDIAKVAYLSCSPVSLRRDLDALNAFKVETIIPYDFYPKTKQIESLVLLRR